jgi:ribosomal protein S18 acetylase RimI-like enzyme
VLTDADQIVGFAIAARNSAAAAEILSMAVDPGRRGRRYGSVLLTHSAG